MIIRLQDTLNVGGPALWVIFGISVVLLTVGLWKLWHLIKLGAWNRKQADEILKLWLEKKVEPNEGNQRDGGKKEPMPSWYADEAVRLQQSFYECVV